MKNVSKQTLIENNVEFVILGTDYTSYGLARIINDNYDMKATLLGSKLLDQTSNSKILNRKAYDNFNKDKEFVESMISFAKERPGKKLFVFPVSDKYTGLLTRHKKELKDYFYFNVPTEQNTNELQNKKDFYKTCSENGIAFPKTYSIRSIDELKFEELLYPIVVKYSDSELARNTHFDGKEKAYIIHDESRLREVLNKIFASTYKSDVIVQDYIPGKATGNYSLNAFCDRSGKVRMMALGQVLLDDVDPSRIGNNNSLYTLGNMDLYKKYKTFLENIGFKGFANFDLKYDPRDNTFKTFEVNVRFPASVFFIAAGGANFIDFYVRDYLGIPYEEETYFHNKCDHVYLNCAKSTLLDNVDEDYKKLTKDLLNKGPKWTLWNPKDKSVKRWLMWKRRNLKTIKDFKKHNQKI